MSRRTGIIQPLALSLVVALGFGMVWAVLTDWAVNAAKDLLGCEKAWEYINFRMDGTPVIERYESPPAGGVAFRDLDGRPLVISRQEAWLQGADLANSAGTIHFDYSRTCPWYVDPPWRNRIAGLNDGGQPAVYWYFLGDGTPPGTGYFVGYDSIGKRRLGYIGRGGFQTGLPSPEQRFPLRAHKTARSALASTQFPREQEPISPPYSQGPGFFPGWVVYVLADDALIEVNLQRRTAQVVLREPGLISAGFACKGIGRALTTDSEAYRTVNIQQYMVIRKQDRLLVFDSHIKRLSSFPVPEDLRSLGLRLLLVNDQSAVLLASADRPRRDSTDATCYEQLVWVGSDGKIIRRKEVSLQLTPSIGIGTNLDFSPWPAVRRQPAPLAAAAVAAGLQPWLYVADGKEATYLAALGRSWSEFWPALIALCVLGAVAAWLCYRRQKRYGLPWTKAWVVFVFLGGIPGLVAYYVHCRWPTMEKCPHCGRPVPRDRPACFVCGHDFPPPAKKGIEVFA